MDEGTNQKDRDQEQGRTEGYRVGKKEDKSKLATMAKENRFLQVLATRNISKVSKQIEGRQNTSGQQ